MILYEATTCLVGAKRVSLSFSRTNTGSSGGLSRTDSFTGVCLYNFCQTVTTHHVELECWINNNKYLISLIFPLSLLCFECCGAWEFAFTEQNWVRTGRKSWTHLSQLCNGAGVFGHLSFFTHNLTCVYYQSFLYVKAGALFGICNRWSAFTNRLSESLQTCCCRHCSRCTGAATRTVFTDKSSHHVAITYWDF